MEARKQVIKILYEDKDILVCVKPAGVASQTKMSGQQDMVSLLRNYRHEQGEEPYIGLVHRLDQPVEGILVFGKHAQSTAALNRQLVKGNFSKVYLAVTEGNMPQQEGKLLDYLKKDGRRNLSAIAEKGDPQAKWAELLYRVLETDGSCCPVRNLVRVQLLTGRHHQIRVQMANIGTPLAGDTKYGRGLQAEYGGSLYAGQNRMRPAEYTEHGVQGQQNNGTGCGLGLCACELEFVHPVKNQAMKYELTPSQMVFQRFDSLSKK